MDRKTKANIIGTAVVGALAIAAIYGITASDEVGQARAQDAKQAEQPAGGKAVTVQTSKPQRRPMTRFLRMPATLLAGEMADLYAKTSGYVSKIEVDIGSRVVAGQPLLAIDVPEMADSLRRAQAVLTAKQAQVGQAAAMVQVAQAEVQRAQAEYELSHINLQRRQTLREGNVIPQQELDEAKSRLAIADAQVKIARARLASAEADVKMAESEVAVSDATLARFKTLMRYATIRAPFDGVITDRHVDPGAFVRSAVEGAARPLLRIERIDFIRLVLEIPESDASFVHSGTDVDIFVKALGRDPIHAKITRSAKALKAETRTMRTEVDLDNGDGRLSPGMYAQVTVKLESKQQALMIPSKAIRVRGRDTSALVVVGSKAEARSIEIGYDDGIWAEIVGGQLSQDDPVIVSSGGAVTPGATVKPVPLVLRQP